MSKRDILSSLFIKAKKEGYSPHMFEKIVLKTIDEFSEMDRSYSPGNILSVIRQAVDNWPNFDYASALNVIKKLNAETNNSFIKEEIYNMLMAHMPKWTTTIKQANQINSLMKSSATKLPNKKLKLEDCINKSNHIKNLRDKIIYG
jgi:hypothetical protein